MKISIESIEINHEIISFIIENNLKLESLEISPNQYYDLIISGDFKDIMLFLITFGYINSFLDLYEYIEEDILEYIRERYDLIPY